MNPKSKTVDYSFYVDGGLIGRIGYFGFTHENGKLIFAIEKTYPTKTNSMIVELSAVRELIRWLKQQGPRYIGKKIQVFSDCQQVVKYITLGEKFEKGNSGFANMLVNMTKELKDAKFKVVFKYIDRKYNKAHHFTQQSAIYDLHFVKTQRDKVYYNDEPNEGTQKQLEKNYNVVKKDLEDQAKKIGINDLPMYRAFLEEQLANFTKMENLYRNIDIDNKSKSKK